MDISDRLLAAQAEGIALGAVAIDNPAYRAYLRDVLDRVHPEGPDEEQAFAALRSMVLATGAVDFVDLEAWSLRRFGNCAALTSVVLMWVAALDRPDNQPAGS